jgi:hypothetical protein
MWGVDGLEYEKPLSFQMTEAFQLLEGRMIGAASIVSSKSERPFAPIATRRKASA